MAKRKGGRRRFWTRGKVLPVAGVTIVALFLGFYWGRSAIGQIDPLYFRGSAPIAQDVSAQARPVTRPAFAEASGWDAGQVAMAHDCGADCPTLHAREAGIAPSSLGIGEVAPLPQPPHAYAADPAPPEEPITTASAPEPRTNRYLHYPVSQEPEPPRPNYTDPAPAAPLPGRSGDPEGM